MCVTSKAALRHLEAEYALLLRAATRTFWKTELISDSELRGRFRLPSLEILVFAARLRYFARFVRHAPMVLWALVQSTPCPPTDGCRPHWCHCSGWRSTAAQ